MFFTFEIFTASFCLHFKLETKENFTKMLFTLYWYIGLPLYINSLSSDSDSQIQILRFRSSDSDSQIQILRFRFSDSDPQIQILRFRFSDSDSQIQILRFRFSDIDSQIQILRFRFSDSDSQIQILRFRFSDSDLGIFLTNPKSIQNLLSRICSGGSLLLSISIATTLITSIQIGLSRISLQISRKVQGVPPNMTVGEQF